jgi:hypothetical protein
MGVGGHAKSRAPSSTGAPSFVGTLSLAIKLKGPNDMMSLAGAPGRAHHGI